MEINIVDRLLGITLLGSEWVLWLLVFLSIFSFAIIIERFFFLMRNRIDYELFATNLSHYLKNDQVSHALSMCEKLGTVESRVASSGLSEYSESRSFIKQTMEAYLISEKQKLDRGLVVLGTLGNNAPFIGLFGTVIGIIKAFHDLSSNPDGGPSVVMSGISEALVATAVGLIVAIPAVIAFNAFNRIIKNKMSHSEAVMKIILKYKEE